MVINAAGDALFTFLPLFLGYTSAKKFGLKPMLGLALGAAVCYPAIQGSSISAGADVMYTLFKRNNVCITSIMISLDYQLYQLIMLEQSYQLYLYYFASRCEKLFNKCVPDLN